MGLMREMEHLVAMRVGETKPVSALWQPQTTGQWGWEKQS